MEDACTIVYDSAVDEFTEDCLFQKVRGKPNVAIVATTTDGDVFGGFYSVAAMEQNYSYFDRTIFVFLFESHGRCETPQRFTVKRKWKEGAQVVFLKDDYYGGRFVHLGSGSGLSLGNEKSRAWCEGLFRGFEGIKDTTLSGEEFPQKFTCCRLVAIQLE